MPPGCALCFPGSSIKRQLPSEAFSVLCTWKCSIPLAFCIPSVVLFWSLTFMNNNYTYYLSYPLSFFPLLEIKLFHVRDLHFGCFYAPISRTDLIIILCVNEHGYYITDSVEHSDCLSFLSFSLLLSSISLQWITNNLSTTIFISHCYP